MTNRTFRIAIALLAAVLVVPIAMQAREHEHGRRHARERTEHWRGREQGQHWRGRERGEHWRGRERGEHYRRYDRSRDDRGWFRGGEHFYRRGDDDDDYRGGFYFGYGPAYYGAPAWYYGPDGAWLGCDLPPGLAMRYGCVPYYHREYYRPYYRPDGVRIWVRIGR